MRILARTTRTTSRRTAAGQLLLNCPAALVTRIVWQCRQRDYSAACPYERKTMKLRTITVSYGQNAIAAGILKRQAVVDPDRSARRGDDPRPSRRSSGSRPRPPSLSRSTRRSRARHGRQTRSDVAALPGAAHAGATATTSATCHSCPRSSSSCRTTSRSRISDWPSPTPARRSGCATVTHCASPPTTRDHGAVLLDLSGGDLTPLWAALLTDLPEPERACRSGERCGDVDPSEDEDFGEDDEDSRRTAAGSR